MGKRFLVMAGGTGGHVFPALAIVKELEARGHTVEWLGTRGRMEERLVPENGITIHYIDVKGVRRNGILSLLKAPFMVTRAVLQARKIIKDFRPDAVIGFGGYASGPGGVASKLCGAPLILHEQNAAAGMTNRLLAGMSSRILLGVGQAFSGDKVQSVGNPVRKEILSMLNEPLKEFCKNSTLRVLIVGGSLGARALNEKLPKALILAAKDLPLKLEVTHQCGKDNANATAELYKDAPFAVSTSDFITDMAAAYRRADLIICRAGALTVSEVSAAAVPAVFVPLPTAVDDHQTLNAKSSVDAGAARLIAQKDLDDASVAQCLRDLAHPEVLKSMALKARSLAKPDATAKVCDIAEKIAL